MKVNFLMVNYNDYENVKKMVDQIKEYQIWNKIVIVDNQSTDNSLSKIKQLQNEKIVVLENHVNGGYGAGINLGVRYLNQEDSNSYIVVSNTDIIIDKETDIKKLLDTFEDNTAVVGPIVREHTGYNVGWRVPTPWQDVILSIPYIYRKYQKKIHYSIEEIKGCIKKVGAISGSFFVIRGNILAEVNYFDENIFLYYEENVLSKKLEKINQHILINGNVEVFHNHSVTIDKVHTSVQKYKNLKKSQYYFQTKYNHAGILNQVIMKILFTFVILGLRIRNRNQHHLILFYTLFSTLKLMNFI